MYFWIGIGPQLASEVGRGFLFLSRYCSSRFSKKPSRYFKKSFALFQKSLQAISKKPSRYFKTAFALFQDKLKIIIRNRLSSHLKPTAQRSNHVWK